MVNYNTGGRNPPLHIVGVNQLLWRRIKKYIQLMKDNI